MRIVTRRPFAILNGIHTMHNLSHLVDGSNPDDGHAA
jgi:hypothetical protein